MWRLFIAFATLQALTSGHGIVFLVVGAIVVVGCQLLVGETIAPSTFARDIGIPGLLLLLPAVR